MKDYPFVKCLNPQQIKNPHTGDVILVECGKCHACLLQKSSIRTLKCKLEGLSHKYTYFITLTYSDLFVPKMVPIFSHNDKIQQKPYFYFMNVTDRFPIGEVLAEGFYSMSELDMIKNKTNLGDYIPYLSKRDAQLFVKRLRKYITFISDEKIRYYLVGELGPVHYRPHLHLELWFSDEQIAENIEKVIHKSWKFGRINIQKSVGKSSSYVAGYLNSTCNLPSIFKQGKTKPFACHSFRLGEAILQGSKEEVYALSAKDFVSRSLVINGSPTNFSLWRSFKTCYYPRCPKYSSLNSMERYKSYTTYEAASEIFGKISPLQQAINIVDKIISDDYWVKLFPVCCYFKDKYQLHEFIGTSDYERAIRRVYMELRISKQFVEFVCDGFPSLAGVKLIEKFYNDCELLNLNEQLDKVDNFIKYDSYSIDDLVFLYHNKPFDIENLHANKLFLEWQESVLQKAADSVKHKILNDKNKIFETI